MLTAFDNYKLWHEALFVCATQEEIHKAASETVENFLENRCIWDELNYFKKNGQILGHHPIFAHMQRVEAIRRLKIGELVNLKIRLGNNLVRNRAAIRRKPGHPSTAERLARISKMEQELLEVNRMLNL